MIKLLYYHTIKLYRKSCFNYSHKHMTHILHYYVLYIIQEHTVLYNICEFILH